MPSSTPYISFPGNARTALEFYRDVFGGTLDLVTYEDIPMEDMPITPPPGAVAHAQLHGGLVTLAGADDLGEEPQPLEGSAYSMMLMPETVEQGRELFEKLLAAGGKLDMPFELAPWGDHFGQVTDQFGVRWQVDVGPA